MTQKRLFLALLLGYTTLELLSWIGYNTPIVSSGLFFAVVIATAVLSWRKPGYGALIIMAELFVGSQGGYMLALGPANIDGALLSLRMGLFLAVFCTWLARVVVSWKLGEGSWKLGAGSWKNLRWLVDMKEHGLLLPYLMLLLVFAFGAIRGFLAGNGFGNVFFDANGYAFFALFPAFVEGFRDLKARTLLWPTLAAAVTVTVVKALAVLYFFSHRIFEVAANMYVWVRDTRVGEVTIMQADFHRVFFQSHLFVLVGLFAVFMFAARGRLFRGREFWLPFALFAWGIVAMLLGLSRSYWFGGLAGFVTMLGLLIYARALGPLWKKMLVIAPVGLIAAVAIVYVVYAFPYPDKTGQVSFASLMGGRAFSVAGEAAANSRWNLLAALWPVGFEHPIFGSGLGTTVTYSTEDARLLADIPDAQYTTFAFEWGYHDLWIKFGLLGLAIYAWLIAAILKPYIFALKIVRMNKNEAISLTPETGRDDGSERSQLPATSSQLAPAVTSPREFETIIIVGITAGTIAMLATNVFSPYLNHPLGIGLLMVVAALGISSSKQTS
ncbi:MAG: hypothetical protein V1738_00375 [Patescibacteria group bacterium]